MTRLSALPIIGLVLTLFLPIAAQTANPPEKFCSSTYNPVCCHSRADAKTRTKANACWCSTVGGSVLYAGHCRPSPTSGPFTTSASTCPTFYPPVCCSTPHSHRYVSTSDTCYCRGEFDVQGFGKCNFGPYIDSVCCIGRSGNLVSFLASQWCDGTVLWSGQCQTACFADTGPVCCETGRKHATAASKCWCEKMLRGKVLRNGRCAPAPAIASTPVNCPIDFRPVCCKSKTTGKLTDADTKCLCTAAGGTVVAQGTCGDLPKPAQERRPVMFCDPFDPIPVCCQSTETGMVYRSASKCACAATKGSEIEFLNTGDNCKVVEGSLNCAQRFNDTVCCKDAVSMDLSNSVNSCACVAKGGIVMYTGACDARQSQSLVPKSEACVDDYMPVCCRTPYFAHIPWDKKMTASNRCWCISTRGTVLSQGECAK